ncbi:DMT family transporter [Maribius pontilimi]|uniref:DMT family transporter n=1 Tax=Palleronia pontilimi TaxID=1964209 RepID=A0A934MCY9_9RHOB|nr:DMT family transporter [Palleronia pontilimi]MBJ3763005.1 DMT family transporter [Palleronia pontilimi]
MSGAIVSFTTMAVAGRAVSIQLDTFELMMYRSLVGIVLVVTIGAIAGSLRQITTHQLGLHAVRNLFHFAGQNLWFYAITVIPLAQVFALEFTSPIWVALAAPLLLAERLTRMRMLAALLGFVGVLVVARPGLDGFGAGQLAAATAAIGFAGSAVFTKILTRRNSITCILFWLTVMQAVFGLLCAGVDGRIAVPHGEVTAWLIVIGCAGLAAHFCLTSALTIAPATLVIPFDFLRLPVIAAIGMLLYGEPFDIYVMIGAGIIFAANYANLWTESRRPGVA